MFDFFKKAEPKDDVPLFIFNSLTREKEAFTSIKEGEVTMYTCGPTVYDYVHLGNLSSYIFADTLKRTFTLFGYEVNHTMNLTDFGHLTDDGDTGEDKMMKGLRREGMSITLSAMHSLSDKYIDAFMKDMDALNMVAPTQYTRASEYVREQIALIDTLVAKGYTYETSDGVYFDISKFPTYGKLGNVDLEKLKEGARVEVNTEKKHPADFALWKKGLLGWESKWGKGFPGWHIECTAMGFATLGKQIDVHTGGEDLKYTHHNGEIAQAEAATGKSPYVRYWLHNAFMMIDDTKISKSLGNGIRVEDIIERGFSPDAFRYFVLTSHYRSQSNFTFDALQGAKQALFRLKRYIFEEYKNKSGKPHEEYRRKIKAALGNDLDTPRAIALLFELMKDANVTPEEKVATAQYADRALGIGLNDELDDVVRELGVIPEAEIPEDLQKLIEQRELARIARNWDEADRLREAINLKGYTLDDTSKGTRVIKK